MGEEGHGRLEMQELQAGNQRLLDIRGFVTSWFFRGVEGIHVFKGICRGVKVSMLTGLWMGADMEEATWRRHGQTLE